MAQFLIRVKSLPRFMTALRYVLLLLVSLPIFGLLAIPAVHSSARHYVYSMATGAINWVLPVSVVLLVLVVAINNKLESYNLRWLEWSPFRVKANITLLPLKMRYLGVLYLAALAYCIPLLAWIEEVIFRKGTENWLQGLLWGGLVFGFAHLISCVTIRMALGLTFAGSALVVVYFIAGLWGATLVHATYNLVAVTWVVWSELGVRPRVIKAITHPSFIAQFPTIRTWVLRFKPWFTAPART